MQIQLLHSPAIAMQIATQYTAGLAGTIRVMFLAQENTAASTAVPN